MLNRSQKMDEAELNPPARVVAPLIENPIHHLYKYHSDVLGLLRGYNLIEAKQCALVKEHEYRTLEESHPHRILSALEVLDVSLRERRPTFLTSSKTNICKLLHQELDSPLLLLILATHLEVLSRDLFAILTADKVDRNVLAPNEYKATLEKISNLLRSATDRTTSTGIQRQFCSTIEVHLLHRVLFACSELALVISGEHKSLVDEVATAAYARLSIQDISRARVLKGLFDGYSGNVQGAVFNLTKALTAIPEEMVVVRGTALLELARQLFLNNRHVSARPLYYEILNLPGTDMELLSIQNMAFTRYQLHLSSNEKDSLELQQLRTRFGHLQDTFSQSFRAPFILALPEFWSMGCASEQPSQ